MMKTIPSCLILALILLISCKTNKATSENGDDQKSQTETVSGHNSQNALDWAGVYMGTMPCADCDGIRTVIKLNQDLSYTQTVQHLGKDNHEEKTSGTFSWDKSGSSISLSGANNDSYKVGENVLMPLDADGNQLNNNLKKATMDSTITEKFWKLIELNGKKVEQPGDRKAIHFVLKNTDSIVNGFGGCNAFNGIYTLDENTNRLRFSKMKTTLRACDRMETESMFLAVLEKTDNYTIKNDTLSLNKARMAPLAKFAAVYLR